MNEPVNHSTRHVHVLATSSWINASLLEQGVSFLKTKSFDVEVGPNVLVRDTLFAGPTQQRAKTLIDALQLQSTVLWCARGGYGCNELLPMLSDWLTTNTPRASTIIGMSDTTTLLNIFALKTPMNVIYGPMVATPTLESIDPKRWAWLNALLGNSAPTLRELGFTFLRGKRLTGCVIGGNLSMLVSLLGTPYDFSYDGKVLFLEDLNEPEYRILRHINQLDQARKFRHLEGIIFGSFNFKTASGTTNIDLRSIIQYSLKHYRFPIVIDFPLGHRSNIASLPLNVPVLIAGEEIQIASSHGS